MFQDLQITGTVIVTLNSEFSTVYELNITNWMKVYRCVYQGRTECTVQNFSCLLVQMYNYYKRQRHRWIDNKMIIPMSRETKTEKDHNYIIIASHTIG